MLQIHEHVVFDTSALVTDPDLLVSDKFSGKHLYVPIEVVSELDQLKSDGRNPQTAQQAREVSRRLADIRLKANGALRSKIGWFDPETQITYHIVAASDEDSSVLATLSERRSMDRYILGCAARVASGGVLGASHSKGQRRGRSHQACPNATRMVTLLTRDINMTLFADSLEGVEAVKIEDMEDAGANGTIAGLHRKIIVGDSWDVLYASRSSDEVKLPELSPQQFHTNEHVLCLSSGEAEDGSGVLLRVSVRDEGGTAVKYWSRVDRHFGATKKGCRFVPRNPEQEVAYNLITDTDIDMVVLSGIAGTGKTFVALAAALQLQGKGHPHIFITKPVVPIGRDVGFLPGSLAEKMAPWIASFKDNLAQLSSSRKGKTTALQPHPSEGRDDDFSQWDRNAHQELCRLFPGVEILPLHAVRGRSIREAIIIVDEAQNLSPHEVKTLVTRAGEGTKFILMGDPDQIDSSYLDSRTNGLVHAARRMGGLSRVGVVRFVTGERSWLATEAAKRL